MLRALVSGAATVRRSERTRSSVRERQRTRRLPSAKRRERSEPLDTANHAPTVGGTMSEPAFWLAKSDDDVGSSMFAPPICRKRWRNTLFPSVSSDEDGDNPANIAASGASNRTKRDCANSETRPAPHAASVGIARRRAEEERAGAFFLCERRRSRRIRKRDARAARPRDET